MNELIDQWNQFFSAGYWEYEVWGNTVYNYLFAGLILVGSLLVLKLFQVYVIVRLNKLAQNTQTDLDDTAIAITKSLRPGFYVIIALFLASRYLNLSLVVSTIINILTTSFIVYQAVHAVQILIDFVVKKRLGKEEEESARSMINMLSFITKLVLWSIGVLFVLSNLGVNVTSLIAGMGVGGLAIALAVQSILGDLLSSLAIFFDKPFQVGDFITVGDSTTKGTVEKIGIKTTRLRSQQGEELVVSNNELTSARIWNYRRMDDRRISFSLGVVYDTTAEQLRSIPEIIKKIIEDTDKARFDRAHFNRFEDSALGFDVVYFVESDDYVDYMNVHQAINLKIKEEFEKAKIEMAYPTQTVYMNK